MVRITVYIEQPKEKTNWFPFYRLPRRPSNLSKPSCPSSTVFSSRGSSPKPWVQRYLLPQSNGTHPLTCTRRKRLLASSCQLPRRATRYLRPPSSPSVLVLQTTKARSCRPTSKRGIASYCLVGEETRSKWAKRYVHLTLLLLFFYSTLLPPRRSRNTSSSVTRKSSPKSKSEHDETTHAWVTPPHAPLFQGYVWTALKLLLLGWFSMYA